MTSGSRDCATSSGAAISIGRGRVGARIGIGPAVEFPFAHAREVIGHQIVTITVAFVNNGIELAGYRMERDAHGITQA